MYPEVLEALILSYLDTAALEDIFLQACSSGCLETARLLIRRGVANFDEGLATAFRFRRPKLMQLMVSKGARNWAQAIVSAKDAETMRGLTNSPAVSPFGRTYKRRWTVRRANDCLLLACAVGRIEAVDFLILHRANNFKEGLKAADSCGHSEIKDLMAYCIDIRKKQVAKNRKRKKKEKEESQKRKKLFYSREHVAAFPIINPDWLNKEC